MLRQDIIGPYMVIGNIVCKLFIGILMCNFGTFLGHPLEALVYSQLRLKVHVFDSTQSKLDNLMMLLAQWAKYFRVILCKDVLSAKLIGAFLIEKHQIKSTLIHEELSVYEMKELVKYWQLNHDQILVITDEAYIEPIVLTSLDLVVHFDYPATKQKFADRLEFILEHYHVLLYLNVKFQVLPHEKMCRKHL